ncbi:AMP-dependent synthetase/ligase [Nonomuraea sp. NPDC050404]|uniref:AMP-dependent synthetase/ligase n=1 Tax=Nonomuraea sp. NPDC050404 TaxID=3155783 RepID=UPI0033CC05A2
MREFTVDALVEIGDDDTLTDALWGRAASEPARVAFAAPRDGTPELLFGELAGRVRGLALRLVAEGVRPGDRVAIIGPTCADWVIADLAVLSAGAITVPIYPTASAEQITAVLRDAAPVLCFAAPGMDVPGAERVWRFGEFPAPLPEDAGAAAELAERLAAARADDVATIVYTSGTTGVPKGCVLTHRNILAAAGNVVALLPELFGDQEESTGKPSTLLFLPLAHVYGRVVLFGCLRAGTRTGLVADAAGLISCLAGFRPTFLVGVPYVLEKIRKAARRQFDERDLIARGSAIRHGRPGRERGGEELRAWLQGLFGGRLTHMICGGASLDAATLDFFAGAGLTVLGAYGLTETASTVSMSAPTANVPGAAGRPVPGTTVAISDDGEILVRGPQLAPGYWPDHAHPAGDWLRTGDLGHLDDGGFLHVTGRRKEILVTSGGKNVAPAPLEDRLRSCPLVSNCMVVGEGRPFVMALITLDPAAVSAWERETGTTDAAALERELERAVTQANEPVSRAESIRAFRVLGEDFTVERGHLTPSLRLRRAVIEKEFAAEIEDVYAS